MKRKLMFFFGVIFLLSVGSFSGYNALQAGESLEDGFEIVCRCKSGGCYAGNKISFRPYCGGGNCSTAPCMPN